MPRYVFAAVDGSSRRLTGTIEAPDREAALDTLARRYAAVVRLAPAETFLRRLLGRRAGCAPWSCSSSPRGWPRCWPPG